VIIEQSLTAWQTTPGFHETAAPARFRGQSSGEETGDRQCLV
jgi:hypothetical protein